MIFSNRRIRLLLFSLFDLGQARHPWRGGLLPRFAPSVARAALSFQDTRLPVAIPFATR